MKQSLLKISTLAIAISTMAACSSPSTTSSDLKETNNIEPPRPDRAIYNTEPLPSELSVKLEGSMVLVKGGSFSMGSDHPEARDREKPVHDVELDNFLISKFELTQDLFSEVMGWNPSYFQCDNCPINNLSYRQVEIFIAKLNARTGKNYRLPTEAEWEFAARGGTKSEGYLYSGSNNVDDVAWYSGNAQRKAHEVGLKQPNELGLYDMTGNMWEFVEDDFDELSYKHHEAKNPKVVIDIVKAKIKMKVTRGSGYEFNEVESLVFMRDMASDNVRMPDIGFRLAHDE